MRTLLFASFALCVELLSSVFMLSTIAHCGQIVGRGTWTSGNTHEYVFVVFPGQTWDAAWADMAVLLPGYQLATITNQEEQDFINGLRAQIGIYGELWIGGLQWPISEPLTNNGWIWVSNEPWNFTNWCSSEPNDLIAIEQHLALEGWGCWNDEGSAIAAIEGYIAESDAVPADLTITIIHSGNFTQGQTGAQYTITVTNSGNGSTMSAVTVVSTLPAGLTMAGISGLGWNCELNKLTCTRSDVVPASTSYPPIIETVNVANNAPTSLVNVVTVSGGGEINTDNDTANDLTTIDPTRAPLAWVTNELSDTVTVIEMANDSVTATIQVGDVPAGIAVNPSGSRVYVAHWYTHNVLAIDTATNSVVADIDVGGNPNGVAVHPDGSKIYVTNYFGPNVAVIDASSNVIVANISLNVGVEVDYAMTIALNPSGTRAYVTQLFSNTVAVIDTTTNQVLTHINIAPAPTGIAVNPTGTRAYVASQSDFISVIDIMTNNVVATIPVLPIGGEKRSLFVAVNPAGTRVYVTNGIASTVSVMDAVTNSIIATIPVGGFVRGIAVTQSGTRIYVASNDGNVYSIDEGSNSVVATIPAGTAPAYIAIWPSPTPQQLPSSLSVVRHADNTIWSMACEGTDTCSSWTQIPGGFSVQPTLTWDPSIQKYILMGIGNNQTSIWRSTFDADWMWNNDWTKITGASPSPVAVAGGGLNSSTPQSITNLTVVRHADNTIWSMACEGTDTCSSWTQIPGGFSVQPTLTWDPSIQKYILMGIGNNQTSIWRSTFDADGTWNNDWTKITGASPSPVAVAGGGFNSSTPQSITNLTVVRHADNTIWSMACEGTDTCSSWMQIPGGFSVQPTLTWDPSIQKYILMGIGNNQASIWRSTFDADGTWNNDWTKIMGTSRSPVAVAGGGF